MAVFLCRSKIILHFDVRETSNFLSLISKKPIMTSCKRFEKIINELEKNPYYNKYSQKIIKFQEEQPKEFLRKIVEKEDQIKKNKECQTSKKRFQVTKVSKPNSEPGLKIEEAKLNSIMKLDLIEHKSKEEISQIWYQYHKQKDCISGILTKKQFKKMFERGKMYNTFLLPLPRENGYEFVLCQFHGIEIHMTPLLWYQTHKENAPECLKMIHYTELMHTKDIVLMKGDFDTKCINAHEAQCLANELQMYYASDDSQRLKLLQTFIQKPNEFKHQDLITVLETMSLDDTNDFLLSKKE